MLEEQNSWRISCVLPFESPKGWEKWASGQGRCIQGNNTEYTHHGYLRHAFDFKLRRGTQVLAARDGIVAYVCDHFREGGTRERLLPRSNLVAIRHPQDGTYTRYIHIMPGGVLVRVGQEVKAGQPIALSGNTGFSSIPHLHFDAVNILPHETSKLRLLSPGGVFTLPSVAAIFSGPLSVQAELAAPLVYLSSAALLATCTSTSTYVSENSGVGLEQTVPLVADVVVLIDRGGAGGQQTFAAAAATAAAAVALSHYCRCVGVIVANDREGHEVFAMAPPQQERQGPLYRGGGGGCGGGDTGGGFGGFSSDIAHHKEQGDGNDDEEEEEEDDDDDDDDDDYDDSDDDYNNGRFEDFAYPSVVPIVASDDDGSRHPFSAAAAVVPGCSLSSDHGAAGASAGMSFSGGYAFTATAAAAAANMSSLEDSGSMTKRWSPSLPSTKYFPGVRRTISSARRAPFPVVMVSQESGEWLKKALAATAAANNQEEETEDASLFHHHTALTGQRHDSRLLQSNRWGGMTGGGKVGWGYDHPEIPAAASAGFDPRGCRSVKMTHDGHDAAGVYNVGHQRQANPSRVAAAARRPQGVIIGLRAAESCPVVPPVPSTLLPSGDGNGAGGDWETAPMLYGAQTLPVRFEESRQRRPGRYSRY